MPLYAYCDELGSVRNAEVSTTAAAHAAASCSDPPLVLRPKTAAFRLRLNFRAARLHRDCHRTFLDRPLRRTRAPSVFTHVHGGARDYSYDANS